MKKWNLNSWTNYPAKHLPEYQDKKELDLVLNKIKNYPPLVFAGETRSLKKSLADVVEGKAFLLQGGDCAESFAEFNADNLRDTFRLILQMAAVLTYGASLPIVKVGRLAGQFAKPRSEATENRDGIELPSYLGDIINGIEFTKEQRAPDPERMIKAYSQAASALNLLRAFSTGGYADLHEVHRWNLDFLEGSAQDNKYRIIADRIGECLDFMKACGINKDTAGLISTVDFFTSHEALLLSYEESLTRVDSLTGKYYDCSSHMLWIGERTRSLNEAHIEFMRGIGNPIGVKIGPTTSADDIIKLINKFLLRDIKVNFTFLNIVNNKNMLIRLSNRRKLNRYDKFKDIFYKNVQSGFLKILKKKPKKYMIIDSNLNINLNKKLILAKIDRLI